MPQINLLPNEFVIDRRANARKLIIKAVVLFIFAIVVYSYAMFLNSYWTLQAQLTTTQQELAGYQPLLTKYQTLKKQQQEADKVKNFLQQQKQSRILWSDLLAQLKAQCGTEIILSKVAVDKDDAVVMTGSAGAFSQVGDLYLRLKKLSVLQNLSIQTINNNPAPAPNSSVQFTFTGKLQRGGVPTVGQKTN